MTVQLSDSEQKNNPSRIHAFLKDLAKICKTHCCGIYLQNEEGRRPTTVVRFNTGRVYEELEAWGNPYKSEASVYCPEINLHIKL